MSKEPTSNPVNNWFAQCWRGERGPVAVLLLLLLVNLVALPIEILVYVSLSEAIRNYVLFLFLGLPIGVWAVVSFWRGGVHTPFYGERVFSYFCAVMVGAVIILGIFSFIMDLWQ